MSQALSQQSTRLRSLWVIGHKVTPLTVGNRVVVVEVTTPVGVPGPPPHYYEDCAEFFFVTAGRLGVMKDGEWASLGPGDHVEVPRGVIHTFRNEGDEEARTITGFDPMGFERFFEEFGCDTTEPGAFETSVSEDTIRRVVEGCARFGMIIAPTQQGTRDNRSNRPQRHDPDGSSHG
jgi:mannose-6-phosphate isomerase-like protein (cupin superfamily)